MRIDHITIKGCGTVSARLTGGDVPAVTLSSDGGEAGVTLVFASGHLGYAEMLAFAINTAADRPADEAGRTDKAPTMVRMASAMMGLGRDVSDDDLREAGFEDADIDEHADAARSLAAGLRDRDVSDDPVSIGDIPLVAVYAEAGRTRLTEAGA